MLVCYGYFVELLVSYGRGWGHPFTPSCAALTRGYPCKNPSDYRDDVMVCCATLLNIAFLTPQPSQ